MCMQVINLLQGWVEIISCPLILLSVVQCLEESLMLSNSIYISYPIGETEESGRVEICVDQEFVDICPGAVDVGLVCSYLGYAGMVLNVTRSLMYWNIYYFIY